MEDELSLHFCIETYTHIYEYINDRINLLLYLYLSITA